MPRRDSALLAVLAFVGGLALSGSASANEGIQRTYARTALSPDGKLVIWEAREAGADLSLGPSRITFGDTRKPFSLGNLKDRILGTSPPLSVRPITRRDEDATSAVFTKDGKSVLFLSARGPGARPQVWALSLAGGEAEPLTDEPTGVAEFVSAPDGSVVFLSDGELRRRQLDAASELLAPTPSDAGDLALSWDGGRLAYRGLEDDLWVLDLATRNAQRLTRREGRERSPRWSFDGASVYFLARIDSSSADVIEGVLAMPASGDGEPARVAPRLQDHVLELCSCEESDRLFAIVAASDGTPIVRIRPAEGKHERLLESPGKLHGLAVHEDGEKMTFVVEAAGAPPEIASWTFPDEDLTFLTGLPPVDSKGTTP